MIKINSLVKESKASFIVSVWFPGTLSPSQTISCATLKHKSVISTKAFPLTSGQKRFVVRASSSFTCAKRCALACGCMHLKKRHALRMNFYRMSDCTLVWLWVIFFPVISCRTALQAGSVVDQLTTPSISTTSALCFPGFVCKKWLSYSYLQQLSITWMKPEM